MRTLFTLILLALASSAQARELHRSEPRAAFRHPDPYTLVGPLSFSDGYPARAADGRVNVVVEVPAGTNAKWEVDKTDGALRWEFRKGRPRLVKYLPYPGNYGMVPSTLLPKELGGDGDPLDVLVLGHALERGTVVRVRLVGVLKLVDGGEQDDKLLAVMEGSALAKVRSLGTLREEFPGVAEIVQTWFTNYKGPGEMASKGFGDVAEAEAILEAASKAYQSSVKD